jgi:hypothetical protein
LERIAPRESLVRPRQIALKAIINLSRNAHVEILLCRRMGLGYLRMRVEEENNFHSLSVKTWSLLPAPPLLKDESIEIGVYNNHAARTKILNL